MSVSLENPRLKLASLMYGRIPVPKKKLILVFSEAICSLDINNSDLVNSIWKKVSSEFLVSLNDFFMEKISTTIFAELSDEDIKAIIEEYQTKGCVNPVPYGLRIDLARHIYYPSIIKELDTKANSLSQKIHTKIQQILSEEASST